MAQGNFKEGKIAKQVVVNGKHGPYLKKVWVSPDTPVVHAKLLKSSTEMIVEEMETKGTQPSWYSDEARRLDQRRGHVLLPDNLEDIPAMYQTDGTKTPDKTAYAKFFCGAATWYVFEIDEKTGEFFGHCDLGMGFPELGYASIPELAETLIPAEQHRRPIPMMVERDLYFEPTKFSEIDL